MNTIILAHYYTRPEVQAEANFVGDSLDLSLKAKESNADRIVFAGVKFMAETAKILNPNAEVIVPREGSTCSLVEDTDVSSISHTDDEVNITYINSSVYHKAKSDWIVTSRNVEDIIRHNIEQGKKVNFTPDRNMGAYISYNNPGWMDSFRYGSAVCEVHDKFKEEELDKLYRGWTDGKKWLLAHPESPLPILKKADFVGSTSKMLEWVEKYPTEIGTIFVATEEGLLYNMKQARPLLDIRLAPTYNGCQCNTCPYMKMNTVENVREAVEGKGFKIDYISEELRLQALKPIERMLEFEK